MQRLKLPMRPGIALLSTLILTAVHAQTLRTESTSTLSPAGEAVIPKIDASVGLVQREVFGMALAALVIFVAAGGGTGGGGVLDPIFILVMGLSAKTAIPLSSITIFGGAIGNFFLNLRRTRDNSTKPLIDWDIILVMQPLLLLGATCGTFLNTIIPTWLLSVLLAFVLIVTGIRTLQKAISARQNERWQCGVPPESTSLLGVDASSVDSINSHRTPELVARVDIPWRKLANLGGLFVVIAAMRTLRGGKNFDSPVGIDSSSALYPFEKQQSLGYKFEPHEIKWTLSSIRFFLMFSFMAGALSGMFGIGGGIINGPLLLEMGFNPSAASAMTATTVLFSSGMSSFNYLMLGKMDLHLAQLMLPMGCCTTYVGHLCLLKVVRYYQCPSLVIFSMALIVLISAVIMSIASIQALLT
ncbi:unnamed protein product [Peronospora effusa]|nr:unnamed protein product [Peronospora effusa]